MPESVNFNLLKVCSMSCNITISVSDDFAKEAKRLAKKYPSFKQDYKDFLVSIKNNPLQGDEITKNIRKIRMAIKAKGKGKSGGARVITFNILTDIENGHVVFLLLYDKEDASTVKVNVVKQLVRDMNYASLTRWEYEAADDMLDELYQEHERLWLKAMEDGESCYL